jgi:hypothetical protein
MYKFNRAIKDSLEWMSEVSLDALYLFLSCADNSFHGIATLSGLMDKYFNWIWK